MANYDFLDDLSKPTAKPKPKVPAEPPIAEREYSFLDQPIIQTPKTTAIPTVPSAEQPPEQMRITPATRGEMAGGIQKSIVEKAGYAPTPESYGRAVKETERIVSAPTEPGGKETWLAGIVSPSAYVPQTEYKSITSALPFSELRRIDKQNADILAKQGAGWLDPLRPRTISSDYGKQVEDFRKLKENILSGMDQLLSVAPTLSQQEKDAAAKYYTDAYSFAPEVGAYYSSIIKGSVKSQDLPTIKKTLDQSLQRLDPSASPLDVLKKVPGGAFVEENILKPLIGTQRTPTGEVVEPAVVTGLRVFNAPVGAVAGALEGAASVVSQAREEGVSKAIEEAPTTISSAIGRYVREGRGFSDATNEILGRGGATIDQAVGRAVGLTPKQAETYGEAADLLEPLGLVVGLGIDLALGPDEIIRTPYKAIARPGKAIPKLVDAAINAPELAKAVSAGDKAAAEAVAKTVKETPGKLASDVIPENLAKTPHEVAQQHFVQKNTPAVDYVLEAATKPGIDAESKLVDAISSIDNIGTAEAKVKAQEVIKQLQDSGVSESLTKGLVLKDELKGLIDLNLGPAISRLRQDVIDEIADPVLIDKFEEILAKGTIGGKKPSVITEIGSTVPEAFGVTPGNIILDLVKTEPKIKEAITKVILKDVAQDNYLKAIEAGIKPIATTGKVAGKIPRIGLSAGMDLLSTGFTRIAPDTFIPTNRVQKVIDAVKQTPIGRIVPGSVGDRAAIGVELKRLGLDPEMDVFTNLPNLQKAFEAQIRAIARREGFFIPANKAAAVVANLKKVQPATKVGLKRIPEIMVEAERQAKAVKLQEALFKPAEIANGIVGVNTIALRRAIFGADSNELLNPIQKEFFDDIKNSWGSTMDKFKLSMRRVKNADPSLSNREAAFKVFVDDDPAGYFDEFLKTIYGGQNNVMEMVRGREGMRQVSGVLPYPSSVNRVVNSILSYSDIMKTSKQRFIDAYTSGNFLAAEEELLKIHTAAQGRPIREFLTSDDLSVFAKTNPALFKKVIAKEKADIVPIFSVEDYEKLNGVNYSLIQQSKMFDNSFDKFSTRYPELFGTSEQLASKWWSSLRAEAKQAAYKDEESSRIIDVLFDNIDSIPDFRKKFIMDDVRSNLAGLDEAAAEEVVTRMNFRMLLNALPESMRMDTSLITNESIKQLFATPGFRYELPRSENFGYQAGSAQYQKLHDVLSQVDAGVSSTGKDFAYSRWTQVNTANDAEKFARDVADLAAPIKAASKDPALADKIAKMKDFYSAAAGQSLKGKLSRIAATKRLTETLEEMILPTGSRVIPPEEQIAILEILGDRFREGYDAVIKATPKGQPPLVDDAIKRIEEALAKASRLAKAGVLGGVIVPNMGYHAANALTAPFIILNTLGRKAFVASLEGLPNIAQAIPRIGNKLPADGLSAKLMKALYNPGDGRILDELWTTSTGQTYRIGDLVDDLTAGSIMKSQAGSELTGQIFEEFVRYAGGPGRGVIKKDPWFRTWFSNNFDPTRSNVWNQFSDIVDTSFRLTQFAKAVDEGRSIEEASRLAREALFDYGSLSNLERERVQKFIWFYTFWSRNLLASMKSVLTNPVRMTFPYRLKQTIERDQPIDFAPEYSQTKIFRTLIEDPETRKRYQLKGPGIPQAEALADLADFAGIIVSAATGGLAMSEGDLTRAANIGGKTASDVLAIPLEKLPPSIKTIINVTTNKDISRKGRGLSPYLDSKFAYYLQLNPDAWNTFTSLVPVETITDPDKIDPNYGTYMGAQYKIKSGYEGRWYLFLNTLLAIGVNRALRDNADVIAPFIKPGGTSYDIKDQTLAWPGWMEWSFRTSGIIDPVMTPTAQEERFKTERQKLQKLRE